MRNKRSALLLAWHEWFSRRGKEWKIYSSGFALSSEPQIWKFTSSFGELLQRIAPKSVAREQRDYFPSFNQSNHWFVALSWSLPVSFPTAYSLVGFEIGLIFFSCIQVKYSSVITPFFLLFFPKTFDIIIFVFNNAIKKCYKEESPKKYKILLYLLTSLFIFWKLFVIHYLFISKRLPIILTCSGS